jgi:hypothetical protein
MRRFVTNLLVVVAVSVGTWLAQGGDLVAASIGNVDPAVLKSERVLQFAVRNKDEKALAPLLDEQFTWTNESGVTEAKAQFLRDRGPSSASNGAEYTDLKARSYGQLLTVVTGSVVHQGHPDVFFVRMWVKRPAGWRLFAYQGTRILAGASVKRQAPVAGNGETGTPDCYNPCRFVPFKPKAAAQQEVVRAYQAVETAATSHDADTWAYHVADEFVGIGQRYAGKPDTKAERIGQIKQRASGPVILPKMVSLQVFVFGDAGVMIAKHQPSAARPFHVIRAWVNRDGRWQLFHRQETTIDEPAAATP